MMGAGQPERPAVTRAAPKIRLFVPDGLAAGARVSLNRDQAHYLGHVMRQREGQSVLLFNGRDGEWSAVVRDIANNRCALDVGQRTRRQEAETGPWLAFAPLKKTATGVIVEKATELGAERLLPVFTRNTNSARVNVDRLAARAREAAEQSGRLTLPEVAPPVALADLLADWPGKRRLLVLDETGGGAPIARALAGLDAATDGVPPPVGFLSGPEGGFDSAELDALRKLDFVTAVGLGPRVLRAETAALAALACWQALLGAGR